MISEKHEQALEAADLVFRLIETEFVSDFGEDELMRLSEAVANYRLARTAIEGSAPRDDAAAIAAADELAGWSEDLVEVQTEPSNEQWKSLFGVLAAWEDYAKARFGTARTLW